MSQMLHIIRGTRSHSSGLMVKGGSDPRPEVVHSNRDTEVNRFEGEAHSAHVAL